MCYQATVKTGDPDCIAPQSIFEAWHTLRRVDSAPVPRAHTTFAGFSSCLSGGKWGIG